MTFGALVHNWRGLQEDQDAVTQPVDPPSTASLCFVGAVDQAILTTNSSTNNVLQALGCSSPDGKYALIIGNRGNNSAKHGYYYSSDHGSTWTYQQWSGATALDSSGAANSSNPFSASSPSHYVVNVVWEPFYERFVIVYDTTSTTRFFWMSPSSSMTEWLEFQETDAANINIRSWIVVPNGDGSLFMGIVGTGSLNGRSKFLTTNGPVWNDQTDIQFDSTSSFARDIFSDQDGTGIDFNVMYHGVKVGDIYQLWVQGGDGATSPANNQRWLRWDGSDTVGVVAERDYRAGYAPAYTFGLSPALSLSFKTGSRTVLPITSSLQPTAASRDAAEYDLPAHPTLGGKLISTGYSETAGWVACGVPDTAGTYPSPVNTDGFDQILVWTSPNGLDGSWGGPFVMDIPDQIYDGNSSCSWIDEVVLLRERSALLYLGGSSTPNKWGLVAPRAGAENEPIVYCFSATAGGNQVIEEGVVEYTENDLYWVGLGPDLYWPLDDTGTPSFVIDLGTKQYPNTTNGADASDISFGEAGPFFGTACEFLNADAEITASPSLTDHWIWAVANIEGVAEGISIFEFEFQWPGGNVTFKIVTSAGGWRAVIQHPGGTVSSDVVPYLYGLAQILVCYRNRSARGTGSSIMETYDPTSPEPADTVEVPGENLTPFFDQCSMSAAGNGVTLDNVLIIHRNNATAEELLGKFESETFDYDPDVGVDAVDITPGTPSLSDTSQPESTMIPSAFYMQENGTGLIFVDGDPSALYRTTDYGDTWTGPFDYSSDLAISGSGNPIVGLLKYEDGYLYGVTSYQGIRSSQVIWSDDFGVTWNRQSYGSMTFGWNVQKVGSTFVTSGRLPTLRVVSAPITSGVGSTPTVTTRDNIGTNDNGLGARLDEDGNLLVRNQNGNSFRYDVSDYSTIDSATQWQFGPGATDLNTALVNSVIFCPEATISAGTETSDSLPTTNEEGTDKAASVSPLCVSNSPETGLQRFWCIQDVLNDDNLKIYAQRNIDLVNGGWSDRYHVNLPSGLKNRNPNTAHAKGAGPYIFYCAPFLEAVGVGSEGYRLLRWESPYGNAELVYPDPETPTAPGNVKCIVNAESPSGLDIGNDAPGAPANDVVAGQASNISEADPKFGSRHLAIPYRSALNTSRSLITPVWRGMSSIEIGNQDFTIEGWWKTTAPGMFGYLGSSQDYFRSGGKLWRYGGMKISLSGASGGIGRMSVYVGLSLGDALANRDNDIYANAVATNLQWNSGFDSSAYNHFAVTRESGVWRFFMNGRQPDSVGLGAAQDAYIYTGRQWEFGMYRYPFNHDSRVGLYSQPSYIDGFRFILADAIYTQNFAVPTSAPA